MSLTHKTRQFSRAAWECTLKDKNGNAVNLTGTTVAIFARFKGATSNKIDGGSVDLVVAASGTVSYTPAAADVDTAGLLLGHFTVTRGTVKEKYPEGDEFRVEIRPAYDTA